MSNRLYFVSFVDDDGTNQDLFMMARDPFDAFTMWVLYYHEGDLEETGLLNSVEYDSKDDAQGLRIYEVNHYLMPRGVLEWHTEALKCVAYVERS